MTATEPIPALPRNHAYGICTICNNKARQDAAYCSACFDAGARMCRTSGCPNATVSTGGLCRLCLEVKP